MKRNISLKSAGVLFFSIGMGLILSACSSSANVGTLDFRANGEDFVREGFVSKDGWAIEFDHVFVNLTDVAAYQTDPPFDASFGDPPSGTKAALGETYLLDLAAGDENAEPILIDSASQLPLGQFNAVSWQMQPASEGAQAGNSLQMIGQAVKDGETINFNISIDQAYDYACGEFIGDERKGFVTEDASGDVELTFHFDHVFGDMDTPADEALNVGAVGFDPLAAVAQNGELNSTYSDLANGLGSEDFKKLEKTLQTLGHVGEGHCYEANGGYTGHAK